MHASLTKNCLWQFQMECNIAFKINANSKDRVRFGKHMQGWLHVNSQEEDKIYKNQQCKVNLFFSSIVSVNRLIDYSLNTGWMLKPMCKNLTKHIKIRNTNRLSQIYPQHSFYTNSRGTVCKKKKKTVTRQQTVTHPYTSLS